MDPNPQKKYWLHESQVVGEHDPRQPDPPGFKGHLYAPQSSLLYKMVALEKHQIIRLEGSQTNSHGPEHILDVLYADESEKANSGPIIRIKRCIISEKFSFGKTVLMVALVCASKCPSRLPSKNTMACLMTRQDHKSYSRWGGNSSARGRGFFPELTVRFNRMLSATLVMAASTVIGQWEKEIKRFAPHLKTFTIDNVRSLGKFQILFRTPKVADIDIILLKVGSVTPNFRVDGEALRTRPRSLSNALLAVTAGTIYARVIVDDFDTIRLKTDARFPPAFFTWLISATRRESKIRVKWDCTNTEEGFLRVNTFQFPILASIHDDILMKGCLNICCDKEYVNRYITTTRLQFRRIAVKGGVAARILYDLNVAPEVIEAIHAGAFKVAAERLNIVAETPGEIIKWVLGSKMEKYRTAVTVMGRVAEFRELITINNQNKDYLPLEDVEEIKRIRKLLKKGTSSDVKKLLAEFKGQTSLPLQTSLMSLCEWGKKAIETHGKTLSRMRENVRQAAGECQCCTVPIEDGSYIINCCQIVICDDCTVEGGSNNKKRRYITRCPNCMNPVDPKTDLSYIGKDINIEKTLDDETLLNFLPPDNLKKMDKEEEEGSSSKMKDKIENITDPKMKAIIQLVLSLPIDCLANKYFDPPKDLARSLLEGKKNSPWPKDLPPKFLIYAAHTETTLRISKMFKEYNIGHVLLKGMRTQRENAISQFENKPSVRAMIATTAKDSSGLHLPFVSHVVFYHHICDKSFLKQASGRAQRLGREYNAEIVCLLDEEEIRQSGLKHPDQWD